MSIFTEPGLYLRNPRGGVEDLDAMKAAGFKSVAINVRDYELEEWSIVINRASEQQVTCLPWGYCASDAEVAALCARARRFPSRAVIVNAEAEFIDLSGRVTPEAIAKETAGLDACLSTLPWTGGRDLSKIPDVHVHLQLFPQENETSKKPRDCRAHAFAAGARHVTFMLGMHGLEPDAFPPRQDPYWVYTRDDIGAALKKWSPQTIGSLSIPYTGLLYGPSHPKWGQSPKRSKTAKALKMTLHNAGFGDFPKPDFSYNVALERAMRRMQLWAGITPQLGVYGNGSYKAIRRLASATPGETYALTPAAEQLIREHAAVAA